MSSHESETSTADDSSSESSAWSPSETRKDRRRRRKRGTAASSPKSESPLPPATDDDNQVKDSMSGDGDGQPSGQPSAAVGSVDNSDRPRAGSAAASRPVAGNVAMSGPAVSAVAAKPIYTPQSCRLCNKPTIYITRSGLSDHATMHHVHWYSAKRDEYIPILEAELEAKRLLIKRNQAHRKFRQDPVDSAGNPTGRGKPTSADSHVVGESKRQGGTRRPRASKRSAGGSDPPAALTPIPSVDNRTVSARRRVCHVDLSQSQVPSGTAMERTETWDEESVIPSSGERPDMAPPAKSRRPEVSRHRYVHSSVHAASRGGRCHRGRRR